MRAAGVLFTTRSGLSLFLKRAPSGDHGGEWCLPGGEIEGDESAESAALREVHEETGWAGGGLPLLIDERVSPEGVSFSTFHMLLDEPFEPDLNFEHSEFRWANPHSPPVPLHPGVLATLMGFLELAY